MVKLISLARPLVEGALAPAVSQHVVVWQSLI
jgi:hypothetical protein